MEDKLNKTIDNPFRVICIDDENINPQIEIDQRITKGEEYIVTNIFVDLVDGSKSYKLLGLEPIPFKGYHSNRFRVSNIVSVN